MSSEAEKVSALMAVSGCDAATAVALLEACQGNLEAAVNMQLEDNQQNEREQQQQQASTASRKRARVEAGSDEDDPVSGQSRVRHAEDDQEAGVRAPIPHKQETLLDADYDDGYSAAAGRRQRTARGRHTGRIRTVFDGFRNFAREAGTTYAGSSNGSGPSTSSSSAASRHQDQSSASSSNKRKMQTLEELFKPPLDLLFKGDWNSAKESAEATGKWLLVNIQDSREFACQLLNRDVWSQESVKAIVREHFIFWQQYRESEDAARYMRYYPVTDWPHVSVLDPRTTEQMVTWTSIPNGDVFCELVANFISLHPSLEGSHQAGSADQKKALEKPRPPMDKAAILEADEDAQFAAAIRASLQETCSKDKSESTYSDLEFEEDDSCPDWAKSSRGGSRPISPSESSNSSSQKGSSFNVQATKTPASATGSSKTTQSTPSSAATTAATAEAATNRESWESYLGPEGDEETTIMIRFPDGSRESKTLPSSSQFKALTLYTAQKGYSPDQFEIVTNFPRRILSAEDPSLSLKSLDLFPRNTVYVQQKGSTK